MGLNWTIIRRIAIVMLVFWLGMLGYLWFPNLFRGLLRRGGGSSLPGSGEVHVYHAEKPANTNISEQEVTGDPWVHVCVASDKNTLVGMIALINSIFLNTKHPVMFHLITDEESGEHLKGWIEMTSLHDIHYELKSFPKQWVAGKVNIRGDRQELSRPLNYARFYIPHLFPDLNGKIIYIDNDCIVQSDIYDLYQTRIQPGHVAAFSEDCSSSARRITLLKNNYADHIDFKSDAIKSRHIDPTTCAFNAGLYVADMKLWKEKNITKQLEHWMELNTKIEIFGNEKIVGGAQPPMMIVFYKNYTQLEPSWHVRYLGWTAGTSYSSEFIKHAKLLHWNGRFKPWGRTAQHTEVWDKYYINDPTGKFSPVRKKQAANKTV